MTERTLSIGGKEVKMKSSAAIPRLYRIKFKRDVFKDLSKLQTSYDNKEKTGGELQIEDLEIFENVAYIMAYHADPSIPETIEDWLDQFQMFSIYEVLPEILKMWGDNFVTDSESKKTEVKRQQGTEYSVVSAAVPGDRAVDQRSGSVDGWDGAGFVDREGE